MRRLEPFPEPSHRIRNSLHDLTTAANRPSTVALDAVPLSRPWDITTIHAPALRWDVWKFLEAFVIWFNSQHAWYAKDQIPACWPQHPPLIRGIGTMAFQRLALSEEPQPHALEEWHRYVLPAFLERTHEERSGCHEKHKPWPGRPEYIRHTEKDQATRRNQTFGADCETPSATSKPTDSTLRHLTPPQPPSQPRPTI